MSQGYFRYPTVFGDSVVFTSEDDLWQVSRLGGEARRLTAGLGTSTRPQFSPDGNTLAFSSAEEGHLEIFVMPAEGGATRRLTYLAAHSQVSSWLDAETVVFASPAFGSQRMAGLCQVSLRGGSPESLKLGPAVNLSVGPRGQVVLERNAPRADPAHWKRYRGGTAGKLWCAPALEGEYKPLLTLPGNLARPLFVGERVYFLSDHEGVGNLYSCTFAGQDLRRETEHKDFYARNPSTDGKTVVYHAGADLFTFDPATRRTQAISIRYHSPRTQRQRRFVAAKTNLESAHLNAQGECLVVTVRGQVHSFRNWDGPITTRRVPGSRYRLAQFLPDGRRLLAVVDKDFADEQLEIMDGETVRYLSHPGWGRFTELALSPKTEKLAFANHRNELWLVDLTSGESEMVARSEHKVLAQFHWSPDGAWLAFAKSEAWNRECLCVADATTGKYHIVSKPLLSDFSPHFSPCGRYLYFLSQREFNPVYDGLQFELSFPKGVVPCLLTLKKETPSPFLQTNREDEGKGESKVTKEVKVEIDFDGIAERVLAFPLPEGKYSRLAATGEKVFFLSPPVEGALNSDWLPKTPEAKASLEAYDFKNQKSEVVLRGISDFSLSGDGSRLLLRLGNRLRVLKATEKFDKPAAPGAERVFDRQGGWIDLQRVKAMVEPESEWRQILHEVWRLQRDHFWREDMSQVRWEKVLQRYVPLLDRLGCRSELGDLIWEMQGELGTSHAYDIGGDYRTEPSYPVGLLGADFRYDRQSGGYRIEKLYLGDSWKPGEACPLTAPGVGLKAGDVILGINGQTLDQNLTPYHALLHQANTEVEIRVRLAEGGEPRALRVRTLGNETPARYRDWVDHNRKVVLEKTSGRVGYVHIPDMGARGFAEFHRHFLRDFNRDALIVDVRYNGGGHVSQLLLEKLCRQRLGCDQSRWFGNIPFPDESPAGPLVALTNEYAGSDGDIFSHSFKLKKAGPLIGRRTWGGVVGIWPRHRLVDGGVTTQPEFSHWFADVGWQVENFGAEPDIEVEIAPHHYRQGVDPQLERGITEVLARLESHPPFRPDIHEFPNRGFEL